jgi:hypothetical protein
VSGRRRHRRPDRPAGNGTTRPQWNHPARGRAIVHAHAVERLGYYIAYHAFEAYVLAPRIMRRAVEVPALVTIVAVLGGGALLGVVGALIAVPVAAGLSLNYDQVLVPRQQGLTKSVHRSSSPTS